MAMTVYVPQSNPSPSKRERQQISIPFIWEERPGIPIKDWKPDPLPPNTCTFTFTPPVKQIASVPFEWEEKPGTPLPFFSHTSPQAGLQESGTDFWADIDDYINQQGNHAEDDMSESQVEASDSESTYESFSSAPSLLANGFIPSLDISSAVPVETHDSQPKTPLSPTSDTGSSVLSFATGTTSLVGPAFLEKLFPLLSPNAGFLHNLEKEDPPKPLNNNLDRDNSHSNITRRPPLTLGELIMMSRRRSYQRKTIQMQKQSISKELMDDNAFGCIFGISNSIGELHNKWKRQLQIKLI